MVPLCYRCGQPIKGTVHEVYGIGCLCSDCRFTNRKPGMIDTVLAVCVLIVGILFGTLLVCLILFGWCSCSKNDDPYECLDVQMISIGDKIILDSLRAVHNSKMFDSARIKKFTTFYTFKELDSVLIELHDDSIGLGTLGFTIMSKVPPDSVLLIRRDGIVWAFWFKNW